jgi:hypothetical protein
MPETRWKKTKLLKKKTDDGFFEMKDDIPIGQEYLYDPDSIRVCWNTNIPTGKTFLVQVVTVKRLDHPVLTGPMPTEFLEGTWP